MCEEMGDDGMRLVSIGGVWECNQTSSLRDGWDRSHVQIAVHVRDVKASLASLSSFWPRLRNLVASSYGTWCP